MNLIPVDSRHLRGKGWRRPVGYAFAGREAAVSLVASEFSLAALSLPIGFVEQSDFFVPVMLTSPVPGHNAAVAPTGQWLVQYVPAVLRSYPFSLGPTGQLCVDEESGLVVDVDNTTEEFFGPDGQLSPSLTSIFELLRRIDRERLATNGGVVALSDAGLIKRWALTVPVGDQSIPVTGIYCVDADALNALDDSSLVEVRRALGLAYAQLLSMNQVAALSRLTLLEQQMAGSGHKTRPPAEFPH